MDCIPRSPLSELLEGLTKVLEHLTVRHIDATSGGQQLDQARNTVNDQFRLAFAILQSRIGSSKLTGPLCDALVKFSGYSLLFKQFLFLLQSYCRLIGSNIQNELFRLLGEICSLRTNNDDPDLAIEWPDLELLYSERDRTAPRLAEISASLPFRV